MKEKIFKVLEYVNEDILTYEGKNMIEDGIVDSFEIIEIVSMLEENLNIEIGAENIIASNFKNKDTIIEMVQKLADV